MISGHWGLAAQQARTSHSSGRKRRGMGGRKWLSSHSGAAVVLAWLVMQTESKQHTEPVLVSGVD